MFLKLFFDKLIVLSSQFHPTIFSILLTFVENYLWIYKVIKLRKGKQNRKYKYFLFEHWIKFENSFWKDSDHSYHKMKYNEKNKILIVVAINNPNYTKIFWKKTYKKWFWNYQTSRIFDFSNFLKLLHNLTEQIVINNLISIYYVVKRILEMVNKYEEILLIAANLNFIFWK